MAGFAVEVKDVKEYVQKFYQHNAKTRENFVNMGTKRIVNCSLEGKEKEKVEAIMKTLNGQLENLFDGIKQIADNLFSFCEDIEDYNKKDLFAEVEAAAKKTQNTTKKRPPRRGH